MMQFTYLTGLVDMVEFMGLGELLDPQRLLCTLSHLEGKYHRTPLTEKLPFPLSLENVRIFFYSKRCALPITKNVAKS